MLRVSSLIGCLSSLSILVQVQKQLSGSNRRFPRLLPAVAERFARSQCRGGAGGAAGGDGRCCAENRSCRWTDRSSEEQESSSQEISFMSRTQDEPHHLSSVTALVNITTLWSPACLYLALETQMILGERSGTRTPLFFLLNNNAIKTVNLWFLG